jgi:hypothetical protein
LDKPIGLPAVNHVVRVKFEYDGGGIGKAATATLLVDERTRFVPKATSPELSLVVLRPS